MQNARGWDMTFTTNPSGTAKALGFRGQENDASARLDLRLDCAQAERMRPWF
jgi:hypothetical protein